MAEAIMPTRTSVDKMLIDLELKKLETKIDRAIRSGETNTALRAILEMHKCVDRAFAQIR